MVDSLSQTFQFSYSGSSTVPGTYLTSIGVFFQSKSPTLGVTLAVMGTTNGYPDSSKIIGTGYLNSNQVNVSNDSSVETVFTFNAPIMINNNDLYAFTVVPDSGSPDYNIFVSELGGNDYLTGSYIGTQLYSGTLFTSSNQTTFVPILTSEIKFNLYRAKFKYNGAQMVFRNTKVEYLSLTGYQRANLSIPLQQGDVVYAANSANVNQILTNTSVYPVGTVYSVDELNQKVVLLTTNGRFSNTSYPVLRFFRTSQPGNTSLLTPNNIVASANLKSIDDLHYHSIVPKFAFSEPSSSAMNMVYYGTSNSFYSYAYDSTYEKVLSEQRFDFTDRERVLRSYSNEVAAGSYGANGTSTLIVNMSTTSSYSSPVLDMGTRTINRITNLINNLDDNESTKYGDALNKYVSLPVAMTITAEDLRLYTMTYRPIGTDVKVYARFLNNHDSSLMSDNPWTLLNMDPTQVNQYSTDPTNLIEYNYYIPVGNTVANQTIAYMDPNSTPQANSLTYYGVTSGAKYVGFDNFAIKIVLLSDNQVIFPTVKTVSAIALLQ